METDIIWDSLKFGETVLLEHDSLTFPYKELAELIMWSKERRYTIVIEDILDTLYTYRSQMELAGMDPNILNDIKVLKTGGRLEVGEVITRFQVSDILSLTKEFEMNYESILSRIEHATVPIVGVDKLFLLAESKMEILALVNTFTRYAGSKRRIAFYFINTAVLMHNLPYVVPLLEELASTVIKIYKDNEKTFEIIKSTNKRIQKILQVIKQGV
ncbi:DUF257 domain-containing protein [Thermococcus argininiproducens]|uniref:DUF257 domain-containing protein n=1 Tax=Thermococcus argininiproducens TaxID=2866384 RepID=A0A9E7SCM0_9EURY|nr:DUF257 family protein [Thermococcus argininiproducens]USG99292.1 DUF257 domain-containing protein [Thermococcus argininiproducens]